MRVGNPSLTSLT
ncbi:hypothetical protein LEMLEM_LOCUS21487 [Lemmus lemmus]